MLGMMSATAGEIAANAAKARAISARATTQASAGIRDATERVAQTATVSQTIAADIAGVNGVVGNIREAGQQV